MPRYKAAKNCDFKPWLTGKPGKEGSGRFNQIDNSWYLNKAVCGLSGNAYKLYQSMAIESGGKPLVEKGFIEMRPDENIYRYRSNIYRFIESWKHESEQTSVPQNGDT